MNDLLRDCALKIEHYAADREARGLSTEHEAALLARLESLRDAEKELPRPVCVIDRVCEDLNNVRFTLTDYGQSLIPSIKINDENGYYGMRLYGPELHDKAVALQANWKAAEKNVSDLMAEVAQTGSLLMKAESRVRELEADIERAFQQLEINGVPRERARNVSNGIDVLSTRYQRAEQAHAAERDGPLAMLRELSEEIIDVIRDTHWAIRGVQLCTEDYRALIKAMTAAMGDVNLGNDLRAIRDRALAKGMKTLTIDEINAAMKGGK